MAVIDTAPGHHVPKQVEHYDMIHSAQTGFIMIPISSKEMIQSAIDTYGATQEQVDILTRKHFPE